ncbi:MAG: sugar transferase, partial [Muribaculaceae bacterium]|nr:sugar transferase [Muribaculaceae bacterium]
DMELVFPLDEVEALCREEKIDQIVIAGACYDEEKVMQILYKLYYLGIPVKIAPDTFSYVTSAIRLQDIYGEPYVDLTSPSLSESSKNVKRFMDVVFSALILLLLSPLYLLLAVMVKIDSKGPVIYSQERIGRKQKPFRIYKFRTMRTDAESSGPRLSEENDPRVTRVGRVLRKYRLDELPQFWNVLKGEMSIVGPRPERRFFIDQIMRCAPYHALVYQVRPGITSWGMVKYGYASSVDQMVERTHYDLIYISNMSLYVDLKILIYTVKTVVTGKGL